MNDNSAVIQPPLFRQMIKRRRGRDGANAELVQPNLRGGGSRADGGADARQAQGSFHFKDHPPRIHGSGGKRGRKQDSKATDLLLTDFF